MGRVIGSSILKGVTFYSYLNARIVLRPARLEGSPAHHRKDFLRLERVSCRKGGARL
ncbi:hypothetical protein [Anaerolinea thermophila]|uniref:hypothetical protein n=1 Tax=Anaerolinea thermophila TaxID=167964 RepID=UPI0002D50F8D|nr:hypothetical protein [Anaerolinea thermophila]